MPTSCSDAVRGRAVRSRRRRGGAAALVLVAAIGSSGALAAPAGAHAAVLKRGSRGPAVVQLQRSSTSRPTVSSARTRCVPSGATSAAAA